jgi:hypothetical protein
MIAEVRYRRIVESRAAITAAVYLIAMGLWIYVVMERQYFYGDDTTGYALLALLAAGNVVAGLLIGRWWALALPVLVVVLSVPAGYPDANRGEPWPIWASLALFTPITLLGVAIGAAVAREGGKPRTAGV